MRVAAGNGVRPVVKLDATLTSDALDERVRSHADEPQAKELDVRL